MKLIGSAKNYAVAALAVFLVSFSIASAFDPAFVPFQTFLSRLGVGPLGDVFNAGLIATGALLFLFYNELGVKLGSSAGTAILAARISSIGMAAVGLFPATIELLHSLAGVAFFVPAAFAVILLTRRFASSPRIIFAAGLYAVALVLFGLVAFTGFFQLLSVLAYASWVALVAYQEIS